MEFLNWTNSDLTSFRTVFFHPLPQAKYIFHFIRIYLWSTKLDPKLT